MNKKHMKSFYNQSIEEILTQLKVSEAKGLTSVEAEKRLEEHGYNQVVTKITDYKSKNLLTKDPFAEAQGILTGKDIFKHIQKMITIRSI